MRFSFPTLLLLMLSSCSCEDEPPADVRDCSRAVFYQPETTPKKISAIGTFNDWDTDANPMQDRNGDGIYSTRLNLDPGTYTYRIWVDGETYRDPFNPLTLFGDFDGEHSALIIEDCSLPELVVESVDASPERVAAELTFLRSHAPIDPGSVSVSLNGEAIDAETDGNKILIDATIDAGKHRLEVSAADKNGGDAETILIPFWAQDEPFDWRDAIIYQVFVDRFRGDDGPLAEGDSILNYYGGTLRGVIDALDDGYFETFSVNTLWLSPVYENPDGLFVGKNGWQSEAYHGYWPTQPRTVETRFGGEDALDELIDKAHQKGMRVILDVVPNHVHAEHPYYVQNESWFQNVGEDCICGTTCPWGEFIQECWFDPFLPDLDWKQRVVVEQQTDDLVWWVDRFDLDGLRVDAVPMMPRLATRHIRADLSERFETGGEHFYLLGENFVSVGGQGQLRAYLGPNGLSGQFDFPSMWGLRDALGGGSFKTLDREFRAGLEAWGDSGAVMSPFLGNHDVPRFISVVNGDNVNSPFDVPPRQPTTDDPYERLKVAWTWVMTVPGAPTIYYGDEIGLAGATDPDNRRAMRFDDQVSDVERGVMDHVGTLGVARTCSEALRRGEFSSVSVEGTSYVYTRESAGSRAVVVLNGAVDEATIEFRLPDSWSTFDGVDVFSGAAFSESVTLGPLSSALFLDDGCSL